MGADIDVYNACFDDILHQWLSLPEYLYKKSISMHIKVKVISWRKKMYLIWLGDIIVHLRFIKG